VGDMCEADVQEITAAPGATTWDEHGERRSLSPCNVPTFTTPRS